MPFASEETASESQGTGNHARLSGLTRHLVLRNPVAVDWGRVRVAQVQDL